MEIKELKAPLQIANDSKLYKNKDQFESLLAALRKRELPAEIISAINTEVELINSRSDTGKQLAKQFKSSQTKILSLLEKKLKIVTENHYRNTWLALGMAIFGIPLGIVFGLSLGNMGFLGIGLPIGLALGIAVGTAMDTKAKANGNQLDLEIKY